MGEIDPSTILQNLLTIVQGNTGILFIIVSLLIIGLLCAADFLSKRTFFASAAIGFLVWSIAWIVHRAVGA